MPKARPLRKEDILAAMAHTKSVRAAARYLNCSFTHIKIWMKNYTDVETGLSLFELHKNPQGKGIPKFLSQKPFNRKRPAIKELIEGRVDASSFTPEKIKKEMLKEGYLKEECHNCGYNEYRIIDNKSPLLMAFKDGNKQHYGLGNVYMLCYNCYFILHGNVFSDKDIEQIEDHRQVSRSTDAVKFDLSEKQLEQLKELKLDITDDSEDPYSLVSRKK